MRVVDYAISPMESLLERRNPQVEHVERHSDAYHLTVGEQDMVVAYLLEISRAASFRG